MFFDEEYEYFDEDILENRVNSSLSVTKFLNEYYDLLTNDIFSITDDDYCHWLDTVYLRDENVKRSYTLRLARLLSKFRNGGKLTLEFVSPSIYRAEDPKSVIIGFEFNRLEETIMEIVVDDITKDNPTYSVYSNYNNFETPVYKATSREDLVSWVNTPWTEEEKEAFEASY